MDNQFVIIPIFLILSLLHVLYSAANSVMPGGSHLSVDNPSDILISPTGLFSAGFYPVGDNAYCFSIWFSKPFCNNNNCTVVWMANRDFPVNGKHSKLILLVTGNVILTDAGKSTPWTTDTVSFSPVELRLLDNGNLVLNNTEGVTVWQSFYFPTDTLLPSQLFTRNLKLVSSRSRSNVSSGFYRLFFDDDNLIHLAYDGPDVSSVYWPDPWVQSWEGGRLTYNSSRIAFFDSLGSFTSSDGLNFLTIDYGQKLQRRLKLDSDGNLRMYSRKIKNPGANWVVSWQAKSRLCQIHGICGGNGICSYDRVAAGEKCSCVPGYRQKKTGDWSYGCEPEFNVLCSNDTQFSFLKLKDVEFYGNDDGFYQNVTLEKCEKICSESCICKGFQYRYLGDNPVPYCYPKMLLINGGYDPSFGADTYVKVFRSVEKIVSLIGDNCSAETFVPLNRSYHKSSENSTPKAILWLASGLGGIEIITILLVYFFLFKSHKDSNKANQSYSLATNTFRRFTYSELKKASSNFCEEIGRGAGGIVYKGILADNRVVAIKQLNLANPGEEEFLAEVSTIGQLNHMNLIDMWGYCAEGKHRLLVYEYMEHGSLMENLSSKALDWKKRFEIALGTARGLAYLHEECLEWVLHCDVKPQNILLDSNYQPKVSDFGLSKLLSRDDLSNNSTFSRIRGTRGYMAPEWVFNLPITSKVDVYSYGIVVLEMVTGKSEATGSQSASGVNTTTEHKSLVKMIREKKNGGDGKVISWMGSMIDPMLEGEFEEAEMEILIRLALQCVEEDKDARPTMSNIVEMLLQVHQNDN